MIKMLKDLSIKLNLIESKKDEIKEQMEGELLSILHIGFCVS
jgi:hypothetical protein